MAIRDPMRLAGFNDLRRKGGDLFADGAGLKFKASAGADADAYAFALAAVEARMKLFLAGWTLDRVASRGECPRCGTATSYQIDGTCPLCRSALRRIARETAV